MPLNMPKIRRLMRGHTVTEIAARMGTTRPALSRLLNEPGEGRTADKRISTLEALARALGVNPGELLKP